jgi:hypothetical protein
VAGNATYSFGAALWSGSGQSSNPVEVVAWEFGPSGVIAKHLASTSAGGIPNLNSVPQYAQGTFTTLPQATGLQFSVYYEGSGQTYEMTDAWVAPTQ